LLRFVENHDEPRAMTALGSPRFRAAAALSLSLPGARLVFMGQLEGRRTKLPVQLAREPLELPEPQVRDFYRRLLAALRDDVFHNGQFFLLGNRPYLGKDRSHESLLAHAWQLEDQLRVVVCNLGSHKASGRVALPPLPSQTHWRFVDLLHDNIAPVFSAQELCVQGLPIFLDAYDAHVFEVQPAQAGGVAS
jgi:1,4-alpha-glucan branching enzyme